MAHQSRFYDTRPPVPGLRWTPSETQMNITNLLNVLRALGAGGLVGALARVDTAAEAVDGVLERTPELAELKSALDALRKALRNR